jgi:hypothetical protein
MKIDRTMVVTAILFSLLFIGFIVLVSTSKGGHA